jgi:hypothetical protein
MNRTSRTSENAAARAKIRGSGGHENAGKCLKRGHTEFVAPAVDETRFSLDEVRVKQSLAILRASTSYSRTGTPEPVLFLLVSLWVQP